MSQIEIRTAAIFFGLHIYVSGETTRTKLNIFYLKLEK